MNSDLDSGLSTQKVILKVKNLKKYFYIERGIFTAGKEVVRAVDGVSFDTREGEIFGIVGESGSGKTTLAKLIVRLLEPTGGKIYFGEKDISDIPRMQLAKNIQIIFQDPFASLNPRLTIGTIIGEAIKQRMKTEHEKPNSKEIVVQTKELLNQVGLPSNILNDYPHQFSGGQRQRIGIARALAMKPKLIVADEPVSSLDISIQAQIVNLLLDLRDSLGLTYILIAHDLNIVRFLADRMAVMHEGKIVEMGPVREVYESPRDPYTMRLLEASPSLQIIL